MFHGKNKLIAEKEASAFLQDLGDETGNLTQRRWNRVPKRTNILTWVRVRTFTERVKDHQVFGRKDQERKGVAEHDDHSAENFYQIKEEQVQKDLWRHLLNCES